MPKRNGVVVEEEMGIMPIDDEAIEDLEDAAERGSVMSVSVVGADEEEVDDIDFDDFLKKEQVKKASSSQQQSQATVELIMPNSDRVTVVGILVDDSSSIGERYLTNSIIEGVQLGMEAFRGARGSDFFLHIQGFKRVYFSGLLADMDMENFKQEYYPNLTYTPLVTTALLLLDAIRKIAEGYRSKGIPATEALLMITDAGTWQENHVPEEFAEKLKGSSCYVEAIGVALPKHPQDEVFYKGIFMRMGLVEENIKTPSSNPAEVRHAINEFSRSVSSIATA